MKREPAYREATERAEARRARMLASLDAAKDRIAPERLKADAKAMATATALDAVGYARAKARQRPVATGAAAGAFILFLFRRPFAALFGRLFVRLRNRNSDISETDDG